ncbi:glycosyltransferase family 2 protein [Lactobacillus crispatus]|uniref:Glycosyltransferase n=1 Tax=Lactobacillus crispatus TaxID=47770 RepID=A0A7H9EBG0_9LACO|nr:glycosyltransferase [Lactobacillus crispatus]QLL74727.1 glycosyltransferase [Lactobacillus crispatus]
MSNIAKIEENKPFVSIIVPVYNVEKFLNQCIDSIVNQEYKNFEVILVDDGSTDNSGIICDKYSKEYSYIHSFHKSNSGLGLTRNYGMKHANGKYIMFVDSDDFLGPACLENLIKPLSQEKFDTVIGGFIRIDDTGKISLKKNYKSKSFFGEEVKDNVMEKMLGNSPKKNDSIKMSVWNNLYSLELIKRNKLQFVSERKYISEDIVWDLDYFQYSKSVKIVSSNEYYYRFNPDSLSHKYLPNKFELYVVLYSYLLKKVKQDNLSEDSVNRLRKQFFINVRSSISQERNNKFYKGLSTIRKICNNSILEKAIQNYPIDKLDKKQRVFLKLIQNRMALILLLIFKLGLEK